MVVIHGAGPAAVVDIPVRLPSISVPDRVWMPPADVYELADKLVIEVELAGCEGAIITAKVVEDLVADPLSSFYIVVEGRRVPVAGTTERFWNERRQGAFARIFTVPGIYDPGNTHAAYEDGLFRIAIAKRPDQAQPIKVTSIFGRAELAEAPAPARRPRPAAPGRRGGL